MGERYKYYSKRQEVAGGVKEMLWLEAIYATIEPVTILIIYDSFKKQEKKSTPLWKDLVSFLLLYCLMLFKQHRLEQNMVHFDPVTIVAMILPLITSFILPKLVYRLYNTYLINKALVAFLCLSLSVDCLIVFILHIAPFNGSNSPIETLLCFSSKIAQLIILNRLMDTIHKQEYELAYAIICIIDMFAVNFITQFILTTQLYKIFGFLVNVFLVGMLMFLLNSLSKKLEKIQGLKGLQHDEQSHYQLMMELAKNKQEKELQNYTEQITSQLKEYKHCSCDNFIISNAINDALSDSLKHNINFQYKIGECWLPLNMFEQNTIIRNILNNAIESCLLTEERDIDFSIEYNIFGEIVLKCVNSAIVPKNLSYAPTSKTDIQKHGVGLMNVRRIVAKRHGEFYCNYNYQENSFTTSITFLNRGHNDEK